MPKSVVESKTVLAFEKKLDSMWEERNPDVLYDPDVELRKHTTNYNIRYYKPTSTNITNTIDSEHASNTVTSDNDLNPEAP